MSQLDINTLGELYKRTSSEQKSLLKGSVDFSSITTNYFNIDDFDALSMKTSETAGPLKIVDYGPSGLLPIEMRKPTIYVQFNQPMVPISKLGEPLRKSSIMTITPRVPGTYRWYGTKILSFEPDSPMHRNRSYSVRISKKATSIHGKELGEDYEYAFLSEFLEMLSLTFGPWEGLHDAQTEIPPDKARQILVTFNQTVDPKNISEHIQVAKRKEVYPLTVSRPKMPESDGEGDITDVIVIRSNLIDHPSLPKLRGKAFMERTVLLEVQGHLPAESRYSVRLLAGARANPESSPREEDQELKFRTITAFRLKNYDYDDDNFPKDNEDLKNPVFLNFSHPVDPESAKKSILVEFEGLDMSDHVKAFGSSIRVANLPVDYGSTYKLSEHQRKTERHLRTPPRQRQDS